MNTTILYIIGGVFIYIVGIVLPTIIGGVIKKKDDSINFEFEKKNFSIQNLYKMNFIFCLENKDYPKNIFDLFFGLFFGILFFVIVFVFSWIVLLVILYIIFPLSFLLGYIPKPFGSTPLFHKYERYGYNDERKWIALWKFILGSGLIYLLIRFESDFLKGLGVIFNFLSDNIFLNIVSIIILIILIIRIFLWKKIIISLKNIKERYSLMAVEEKRDD